LTRFIESAVTIPQIEARLKVPGIGFAEMRRGMTIKVATAKKYLMVGDEDFFD